MRQDYHQDSYGTAGAFYVTVVKLIDGFIGQVMFGDEIVHQTELVDTADTARETARVATVSAVKRLFNG